jgi:hypothetical protein
LIYNSANVDCEKSEIKPQLVTGSKNFVVGRILATVGGSNAKWQNGKMVKFYHFGFYHFGFNEIYEKNIVSILFSHLYKFV